MNKIITCIDGSALASDVCNAGIWAAKRLSKTLMLLHTIEKEQQHGADDLSGAIGLGARSALLEEMALLDEKRGKITLQLGKELLDAAEQRAVGRCCINIEKKQRHGDVVEALIALEPDARLMVVGRSGEGHNEDYKAVGSHLESLIRQVNTPIVIATKDFTEPKNFMLAYDGGETADKAVERIIQGGLLHNLECHLVMIKTGGSEQKEKFEQAIQQLENKGFVVKASYLEGDIFKTLTEYKQTNHIELLVMGAFSHSAVRQFFLGSNTMKIIATSCDTPLIIIK